jgi:UDP-N-acetylmuramoyl-L-alanyl-D-glutamate--2,6-diaminopimelate ligase
MRLADILKDTEMKGSDISGGDIDITSVECDSRKIVPGSLFIAMKGAAGDGNGFIKDAVAKGARVIVTEKAGPYSENGVMFFTVPDTKDFLKQTVLRFYGDVSKSINVIGVTGTNGKTTITYLIESMLKDAGKSCGVIGTVNYRYGGSIYKSNNTTPGIIDLQALLSKMFTAGESHCVMEVSSHALDQGRVDLIDFQTGIFTNLTSDHLDYHQDRDNYFKAKAKLFTKLQKSAHAVINTDDTYGNKLLNMTGANIITYGINGPADVMAEIIRTDLTGTEFLIRSVWGEIKAKTPLIGIHNIYNILAAVSACLINNIRLNTVKDSLERITYIPGRMERVDCGQKYYIFIDYAHTEDALENVLNAVRKICSKRIILVFGCGGDRDKTKRPKMGAVASRLADISFITSDNSRSENTEDIIRGIIDGFANDHYIIECDRRKAIELALWEAGEGDVVLIAGKGHETYQIFKDRTIEFDERKIVKEILDAEYK